MSTLHTNTVETSSGGPVTLTKQSAAKTWLVYDNTGTASTLNSFNISSVNDYAAGQWVPSYTNNFTDANYAFAGAVDAAATANIAALGQTQYGSAPAISSSSTSIACEDVDGAFTDYDRNTIIYHGDLA